jgi:hypothetical protein
MRIAHKGTEPGTGMTVDEVEYTADDEGYFEVPDHVGFAQIKFPGWKQFGADHFTGDTPPAPGAANSSEDYAAISRRLDVIDQRLDELTKAPKRATQATK